MAKLNVLADKVYEHLIGDVAMVVHDLLIHRNDQERIAGMEAIDRFQDAVVKVVGLGRWAVGMPFAALGLDVIDGLQQLAAVVIFVRLGGEIEGAGLRAGE